MASMPDAGTALTVLGLAAGYALLIERLIEFLKHLVEGSLAGESENEQIDQLQALNDQSAADLSELRQIVRQEQERAAAAAAAAPPAPVAEMDDEDVAADEAAFENQPAVALRKLEALSVDDSDLIHRKLFYLLAALGLGVALASIADLRILGALFAGAWECDAASGKLRDLCAYRRFVDQLLTGIVIAGGSQPVHLLLSFITTRAAPAAAAPQSEEEAVEPVAQPAVRQTPAFLTASTSPATEAASDQWVPIPYQGGVKPASLEQRNLRRDNPDLIVYHHTAMSSSSSFSAVVDEFLVNKGWSTGYHCVIMPDGAIRPFCRWDRVGNHTKGHNSHSLGVAFHGNFHSDPGDRYSNHDGSYGNRQPTQQQINAGARLVALWVLLYDDIRLDFDGCIMAHRDAKPGHTVCPGSEFPQQRFEALVARYYRTWSGSLAVRREIEAYKRKPYLYAVEQRLSA